MCFSCVKYMFKRFAAVILVGSVLCGPAFASTFDDWIKLEAGKSKAALLANIAPAGTLPGFIAASPSLRDPNYFFHWTRDAALTISAIEEVAALSESTAERAHYFSLISDYTALSARMQQVPTLSGKPEDHFANIGEPKFNTDGSGFTGEWGRPQADGPALRAIALIHFIKTLSSCSKSTCLGGKPEHIPVAKSVIAADLEYLMFHGQRTSFDLWEETKGHQFYTELVQRRAFIMAADDAESSGDLQRAERYRMFAEKLSVSLPQHWNPLYGYLVETLGRDGGVDYKTSDLDSGIILAVLHAAGPDNFFGPSDDRVLATAIHLKKTFKNLYPINHVNHDSDGRVLGPAIGRYPEDRYDGATNTYGHPWPLITLGMAELEYRLARVLIAQGQVTITMRNLDFYRDMGIQSVGVLNRGDPRFADLINHLILDGDSYLARVKYHALVDGALSEQIDRNTGKMRSANDLTWSYAAYLTAVHQRQQAVQSKSQR